MDRIKTLKKLDSLLGRLLIGLLPAVKPVEVSGFQKVLFLRPGGFGDAVLLIPVLQAFKEKYPDATIDILAEKRNSAIFKNVSCR